MLARRHGFGHLASLETVNTSLKMFHGYRKHLAHAQAMLTPYTINVIRSVEEIRANDSGSQCRLVRMTFPGADQCSRGPVRVKPAPARRRWRSRGLTRPFAPQRCSPDYLGDVIEKTQNFRQKFSAFQTSLDTLPDTRSVMRYWLRSLTMRLGFLVQPDESHAKPCPFRQRVQETTSQPVQV